MRLQTLDLSNEPIEESDPGTDYTIGFWKRQFLPTPTKKQTQFDWAYGVGIPLICVAADPVVFTGHGLLAEYKLFAYTLSATSILGMAAWLLWREKLGWLAAPLGGLFVAGSFVSFVVGVILLPFSLFGLLLVIGFLGFTPLFSALVYLRNGIRAINASAGALDENSVWRAAILTAMLALVIPYVANATLMPAKSKVAPGQDITPIDGFELVNR